MLKAKNMALDNRKTKEELKQIADEAKNLPENLDELDKKEKEAKLVEENPEPTEEDLEEVETEDPIDEDEHDEPHNYEGDEEDDEEPEDSEEDDEEEDTEPEEPAEPTEPKKEEPQQPSAEELYKESSREATTLYFRNKKITDVIEKASDMPEPTESEMKDYVQKMGESYDNLDAFAKNLLKETMMTRRWQSMVNEVVKEDKKLDAWMGKVEDFVTDEKTLNKYPSLANAEDDFKKFASKPNRRGLDMDDLVGLFLYKRGSEKPPRKKGKEMLLGGGNGRNQPPKKTGMNEDDLVALRKRSPKKYMEVIRKNAGKKNKNIKIKT